MVFFVIYVFGMQKDLRTVSECTSVNLNYHVLAQPSYDLSVFQLPRVKFLRIWGTILHYGIMYYRSFVQFTGGCTLNLAM